VGTSVAADFELRCPGYAELVRGGGDLDDPAGEPFGMVDQRRPADRQYDVLGVGVVLTPGMAGPISS
jgi:hypothetical protein